MNKPPIVIGQSEYIDFPEQGIAKVPARIDTGARTSALWASNIIEKDGTLHFCLFGEASPLYNGAVITVDDYELRAVTPSNGITEERYAVLLLVCIAGRTIRAHFTLADRSTQKYPVLVGRNILRGKFIVDIKRNHVKPSR